MAVQWEKIAFSDDIKPATQIEVSELNTATYDDVQDFLNNTQSSGYFDGGEITANAGGTGTIDVAGGSGFIRASNSAIAELKNFDWAASSNINITDELTNYIYVDYAAGTPVVGFETTRATNGRTRFYLGKVFREGTGLHILQAGQDVTEILKRIQSRINSVHGQLQRSSGMVLSEIGTRNLAVTAGTYFAGFTMVSTSDVDTSDGDTFEYYYLSNGTWVESDQTAIDNVQYNDVSTPGSEALANVGLNNFGVHWVYMDITGDLLVVYGQDDYNKLSDAEAAHPPSVSYGHVADMSMLIGRIIIERNGASFDAIESAFDTQFNPAVVTDHGDLSGLSDDDHAQYLLVNGTRAMSAALDMGTQKINNVVDPAADQDAATKKYVDDNSAGVSFPTAAILGTL